MTDIVLLDPVTVSDLPRKRAYLGQTGVSRMLDFALTSPEQAAIAAETLLTDPYSVIEQVFRLTSAQRAGLTFFPESDLRAIAADVAAGLQRGDLSNVEVRFISAPVPDQRARGCGYRRTEEIKPNGEKKIVHEIYYN